LGSGTTGFRDDGVALPDRYQTDTAHGPRLDRGQDAVVAGYWLSAGRFDLASRDLGFDARRCCQL
jgi:hypothetical protein